MKALIVGAGVCGPITAMALQRAGIDAVVYEAHQPPLAEVGSYLTVATNGLDALRAIDADAPVMAAGFPTGHTVLFSGTGKRLGAVPIGSTGDERIVSHTIKRAHLHRVLHLEARRRGVAIKFAKRLLTAQATASGVRAEFDDGSHATGDVLIGCDGVHSVTRTIIDPGAPKPRYVGLLNFGGYTPNRVVGEPVPGPPAVDDAAAARRGDRHRCPAARSVERGCGSSKQAHRTLQPVHAAANPAVDLSAGVFR
jgi:FAD-dependent urate hydroxylase